MLQLLSTSMFLDMCLQLFSRKAHIRYIDVYIIYVYIVYLHIKTAIFVICCDSITIFQHLAVVSRGLNPRRCSSAHGDDEEPWHIVVEYMERPAGCAEILLSMPTLNI